MKNASCTQLELNGLCKRVAKMTGNNDHTGAKIAIARFFNLSKFIKIFEAIQVIHNEEGSMPIGEYRATVGKRMLGVIKQDFGVEIFEQVHNAL